MANSTPSSVLNELAKSNKVTAHYQVVSETGPAHQKQYKVHLRIGGHGPFEGIGTSLKSSRNAAASHALMKGAPGLHLNPTVELNILSMKSGEIAIYRELDSVSLPPRPHEYDSLFTSHQQYSSLSQRAPRPTPRLRRLWRMSVTICGRTYIGEGQTKSEARGNAASHALLELKALLMERAKMLELERVKQQQQQADSTTEKPEVAGSSSFVSKLHEIANRHHLEVSFTLVDESGPPHVKIFCMKCKVGEKECHGQGVGKKAAKNNAAENMLALLKDLPDPPEQKRGHRGRYSRYDNRKKDVKRVDNGIDQNLDSVTYLTQLMQLRKESQPEFTLKADAGPQQKGLMRYQIEAAIPDHKAAGYGETKKAAKTNAATNLLKSLGIDLQELRAASLPNDQKEGKFSDILNMAVDALKSETTVLNRAPGSPVSSKITLTKADYNNIDQNFTSAKEKLDFIARTEGFQVLYNDFVRDKAESGEFSSSLAIFTTPPEVFQGVGTSVDASREDAAKQALQSMTKDGKN